MNLPKIFNHVSIIFSIPMGIPSFKTHPVIYRLEKAKQSKCFVCLELEGLIRDNSILIWQCADSSFKDKDHGHILTGDIRIIDNKKLTKLFKKRPKYREYVHKL